MHNIELVTFYMFKFTYYVPCLYILYLCLFCSTPLLLFDYILYHISCVIYMLTAGVRHVLAESRESRRGQPQSDRVRGTASVPAGAGVREGRRGADRADAAAVRIVVGSVRCDGQHVGLEAG